MDGADYDDNLLTINDLIVSHQFMSENNKPEVAKTLQEIEVAVTNCPNCKLLFEVPQSANKDLICGACNRQFNVVIRPESTKNRIEAMSSVKMSQADLLREFIEKKFADNYDFSKASYKKKAIKELSMSIQRLTQMKTRFVDISQTF